MPLLLSLYLILTQQLLQMLDDEDGLDLVVAGLVVPFLVLVPCDLGGVDEAQHLPGLLGFCH